jgi:hypothetical protein
VTDVHNYRPITLTPIFSKVFENLILQLCQDYFLTDELQCGFKQDLGCIDIIFVVKTTVNYFVERGSCVYAAAIDLSKAFDRVNHYKLLGILLKVGIPLPVVNVIANWYDKLFVAVRWNDCLSMVFSVHSGVRQGGTLSPTLFSLYINSLITRLRDLDVGCHIHGEFYGCFLYADDIIILSPSVHGLQLMLDACSICCDTLSLKLNYDKSKCIIFGKCCVKTVNPMMVQSNCIPWVDSIKYLGFLLMEVISLLLTSSQ